MLSFLAERLTVAFHDDTMMSCLLRSDAQSNTPSKPEEALLFVVCL